MLLNPKLPAIVEGVLVLWFRPGESCHQANVRTNFRPKDYFLRRYFREPLLTPKGIAQAALQGQRLKFFLEEFFPEDSYSVQFHSSFLPRAQQTALLLGKSYFYREGESFKVYRHDMITEARSFLPFTDPESWMDGKESRTAAHFTTLKKADTHARLLEKRWMGASQKVFEDWRSVAKRSLKVCSRDYGNRDRGAVRDHQQWIREEIAPSVPKAPTDFATRYLARERIENGINSTGQDGPLPVNDEQGRRVVHVIVSHGQYLKENGISARSQNNLEGYLYEYGSSGFPSSFFDESFQLVGDTVGRNLVGRLESPDDAAVGEAVRRKLVQDGVVAARPIETFLDEDMEFGKFETCGYTYRDILEQVSELDTIQVEKPEVAPQVSVVSRHLNLA